MQNRSLYVKLLAILLGAWWGFHAAIYCAVRVCLTQERRRAFHLYVKVQGGSYDSLMHHAGVLFVASLLLGTVFLALVVLWAQRSACKHCTLRLQDDSSKPIQSQ